MGGSNAGFGLHIAVLFNLRASFTISVVYFEAINLSSVPVRRKDTSKSHMEKKYLTSYWIPIVTQLIKTTRTIACDAWNDS